MAKQKLKEINDPELNKQGVSIFTIWQYKFLIYTMYSYLLLSFVNVVVVIVFATYHIEKSSDNGIMKTNFVNVVSYVISSLYQLRKLFAKFIDASIMFEWIALLMLIFREKYYSAPELLYQALQK
tara:strand:- start:787 stop:1161 length:375 start_codon:yes stop_codon:yes gene_type:complete